MLELNTRKVLQSLTKINEKMIFTYPRMCVKMGLSVQAFLDLDKLGEEQFNEFGIFDFNGFASSVNIDKDPEISLVDIGNRTQALHIIDKTTNGKTKHITTQIETLEDMGCRGDLELPDKMLNPDRNTKIVEFEISRDQFDILRKKAKQYHMTEVTINANINGDIKLGVNGVEESTNDYSLTFDGEVIEDINMVLDIKLVDLLPIGAYKIAIIKSKKGNSIPVFISTTIDGLIITMARKMVSNG